MSSTEEQRRAAAFHKKHSKQLMVHDDMRRIDSEDFSEDEDELDADGVMDTQPCPNIADLDLFSTRDTADHAAATAPARATHVPPFLFRRKRTTHADESNLFSLSLSLSQRVGLCGDLSQEKRTLPADSNEKAGVRSSWPR